MASSLKKFLQAFVLIACICQWAQSIPTISNTSTPAWGFFGHKLINRMAVFTLPPELLGFYKTHIDFVSDHAVDPDKRRYALKNESYRHYIDVDHWDTIPFPSVPRDFKQAKLMHFNLICLNAASDTFDITNQIIDVDSFYKHLIYQDRYSVEIEFEEELNISNFLFANDTIRACEKFIYRDDFVKMGVLPYFLEEYYLRLVRSMDALDLESILKISADIGHYLGDAHVPLHTTENYNGQLSDQVGIHAFWESRLPELFAQDEYDFFVGKAEYIDDKQSYFWNIIIDSHSELDKVLAIEQELKEIYPSDQQLCFDERSTYTIWTQCPEFSEEYHIRLDGMVEQRMRASIEAIGDVWYSAWIDAGQPDLEKIAEMDLDEEAIEKSRLELDKAVETGNIKGRNHSK